MEEDVGEDKLDENEEDVEDLDAVMKRHHSTQNTSQDFPEKEARQPKRFFSLHFSSWKRNT